MNILPIILALGFIISCIGIFARIYMDRSVSRARRLGAHRGRNTELTYLHLVKQQRAPSWPLVLAASCIPLGIVIIFGAILWNNHLRLR